MKHLRKITKKSVIDRVGRRGGALLTFAFIDYCIAYSLVDFASQPKIPSYRVIASVAPYPAWAALWAFVGTVCLVQAFARVNDRYGFLAAMYIKVIWSGCFAAAWIFYDAYRAWLAAAVWFVFGLFVLLISGWREPTIEKKKQG